MSATGDPETRDVGHDSFTLGDGWAGKSGGEDVIGYLGWG